jgi:hypothetical protein
MVKELAVETIAGATSPKSSTLLLSVKVTEFVVVTVIFHAVIFAAVKPEPIVSIVIVPDTLAPVIERLRLQIKETA